MNYTRDCQYCEWHGQANRYPDHLTECPGVVDAEAAPDDDRGRDAGQLVADGGHVLPSPGDVVEDREEDDDRLVVAYVHDTAAGTWWIEGLDATVAEVNPEYPEDDRVVSAVYLDDLRERGYIDAPGVEALRDLLDGDLRGYDFPAGRLRRPESDASDRRDARASGGGSRV